VIKLSQWCCFSLARTVGGALATKGEANGRCTNDCGSCTKLCHDNASVMALGGTWMWAMVDETGQLLPLSDPDAAARRRR